MTVKAESTQEQVRPILIHVLMISASFFSSLLLSGLFLSDIRYRAILSLPASAMLFFGVRQFVMSRRHSDQREQYRSILSHLLAQASIGRSLEQSLVSTKSALSAFYQARHPLHRTLHQVERQILANQTASAAIDLLVRSLNCTEATIGLGILRRITLSGSSLLNYLRQAYQSLADLMEISRDIAAQNARTSAEAGILAIMPFIMTALLRHSGGYLEPVQNNSAGVAAFGIAFLAAILALSLIPGMLSPEILKDTQDLKPEREKAAGKLAVQAAGQLRHLLIRVLGDGMSRHTDEALMRVYSETKMSRNSFDLEKFRYLVVGLLLGVIFAISLGTPLVVPVPALILIFVQDQLLFRRAKHEELLLLSTFPFFLHICISLLEAGLTMHHVLNLVSGAFSENDSGRGQTPMFKEARKINQSLRAGLSVEQVLDQLALQSTTSELRASYQLLSRYSQLGGQDLLHQLLQQTKVCWTVYRNASRSQLEEQSMKMLLPMMLDLFVIMLVSITPAILFLASGI